MRFVRWFQIVAPLILLLALAIHPGTGWLVRLHLGTNQVTPDVVVGFPRDNPQKPHRVLRRLEEVTKKLPHDYHVRLGWAVASASRWKESEQLRPLLEQFSHRPSLCAHILRYSTMSEVAIRRPEESLGASPTHSLPPQPPPSPGVLREFDRVAALGERLDPDNAFFPMMRALGYFAGNRDREAVQALLRASQKPRYDDYIHEEPQSLIRLHKIAYGPQLAIWQVSTGTVMLFPHYARFRSMARMGQYMAMQADKAGRGQDAAEIRLALMRCGSLMRRQARSSIGSFVGMAISTLGGFRPRPDTQPESRQLTPDQIKRRTEQQRQEFIRYLERLGKHEDAAWAQREFRAMDEHQALLRQAIGENFLDSPQLRIAIVSGRLAMWSMTLLGMALSALLLWIIWLPLSRLVREGAEVLFGLVIVLFVVGIAFWLLPLPLHIIEMARGIAVLVELNDTNSLSGTMAQLQYLLQALLAIESRTVLHLFGTFGFMLWLVLLAVIITVVGLIRGQNGTKALSDGLRRHLPLVALFLLLIYTLSVLHSARMEQYWAQEIQKIMENETAYLLGQIGKSIP